MVSAEPLADRLGSKPRSATQTRILTAALDLFAEHGVGATSLQMIADAVGVPKGAIYPQFKTKDEIIIAVTEMQLARLQDALDTAETAENQPRARELLLNRVIDMAVEQRHIVSVLQFDPVIIRFLAEHEPFKRFLARLYGALVGDVSGTESRVQTAMLSSAIGSAVIHPLVADLDDDTLRSQLLHLAGGLIDLRPRLPADTVDIEIPWVSHRTMVTRLRRFEQVGRNREIVLAAARRVFLRRGYAGASLEAIAEEAGFSKGVVYSQFGSKPDLFFALLDRRIDEWAGQNEQIAAEFAGAEGVQELLRAVVQEPTVDAGWQYLLTEFRALAMRDPNLNQRYAAAHARTVAQLESVLLRLHEAADLQPAGPVRSMAEFILAQAAGIALERAANPDAIPPRDVARILSRTLGLHDSPSPESVGLA